MDEADLPASEWWNELMRQYRVRYQDSLSKWDFLDWADYWKDGYKPSDALDEDEQC